MLPTLRCRSSEKLQDLPEQRVSHVVYRFNPLDPRCGINLDEIDPSQWKLLENATDDYIEASKDRFQELADLLLSEAPEPGVSSFCSLWAIATLPNFCLSKGVWLTHKDLRGMR